MAQDLFSALLSLIHILGGLETLAIISDEGEIVGSKKLISYEVY